MQRGELAGGKCGRHLRLVKPTAAWNHVRAKNRTLEAGQQCHPRSAFVSCVLVSFLLEGTMKGLAKFCFFSGLLVASLGFQHAQAQVDYSTATLKGVVYDPLGAGITKASVTVTNASTGFTKTVQCNAYGSDVIPGLQPGVYQIGVEAPGFQKELFKTFN